MPQSVWSPNADLVTFEVLVDGAAIPDRLLVRTLRTDHAVEAIPTATLVIADGDPAEETFEVSESATFAPGRRIELKAGYHDTNKTIFTGVILRHAISVDESGENALTLTCHDPAFKLTRTRSASMSFEKTDADVMQDLAAAAGHSADVTHTGTVKEHHAQGSASDWDYLLRLARNNGHILTVKDGTLRSAPPTLDGADLEILFGDTLMEADLNLDATAQWAGVTLSAWDAVSGTVLTATADEPQASKQGNITGTKLADAAGLRDWTSTVTETQDLAPRATALLQRIRLSRITGTVKCTGNAGLGPDTVIALAGLGARFNGDAYVSRVVHDLSGGGWTSTVTIGLPSLTDAPRAHTALWHGLQIGKLVQTHSDPTGSFHVKVTLPLVPDSADGLWVRIARPSATLSESDGLLPEEGDEVVLGFLHGDVSAAIVLGVMQPGGATP
ncbi:Phage late control gene D protein (GPD) [Roseovarius sp. THAF9]|uniref:phage baseplate assembly protein V n=1 Tax=Roseovarius sp. THAF9 TaxID=2587847 RepID=UPI001267E00A|nr:phage baseplate assembly protein V [Roseovarius sp. THAF9]QFT92987.1 Phage late control gene D protein (GPD) [Roseovarius sp. THAF9]